MAYKLEHAVEGSLLKVWLSGASDPTMFESVVAQVWQLVQTPGVESLLVDIRELEGRVSLGQTFFNIRGYPLGGKKIKTAVIELPQHMERASFHDTAAANLGYNIRHFNDEAEAREWLASEALSAP